MVEHNHTIYLFTNANGVTAACEKVLGRKLVLVNRKIIATKVDNNVNFWKAAFQLIHDTLSKMS